jgi:hypothetical protein
MKMSHQKQKCKIEIINPTNGNIDKYFGDLEETFANVEEKYGLSPVKRRRELYDELF